MILVDPGHGGKFPGAVANGLIEKEITLKVSRLLRGILNAERVACSLTRDSDHHFADRLGDDLAARVKIADDLKPSLFLSLHCNAHADPRVSGLEVFTSEGQTAADGAATAIFSSLKGAFLGARFRTDLNDGDPDKEENFYVLRKTSCPAVLVEIGFLTNKQEAALIASAKYQSHMALALASGILGRLRQ